MDSVLTGLLAAKMKRRAGMALLCGVLATLTLPPFFIFPLLVPAFSGLFLLLDRAENNKQRFWLGWYFGLGYFVSGLYWFAYSLLVDAEKFAWMIPFAVLGLPSILAIYYGLAGVLYGWVKRHLPRSGPLLSAALFALIWLLIEFARGHLFTGFPWNLIALSWTVSLPMMQMAGIFGSYGMSAWTVLLAALPAAAFWPQSSPHQTRQALSLCLLMLVLPFGYGKYRLSTHPTQFTDITLKLVQPSIPQAMKMSPDQRVAMIEKHVAMSRPAVGEKQADLVIWSETAYPFVVQSYSPPLKYIASRVLKGGHSRLISGGVRIEDEKVTNSLNVIDAEAKVSQSYDKIKLVPFGEFIPLRWLLPIESVAQGMQDFTAGTRGQRIHLTSIPSFLPLICYEVIFPEMAASPAQNRPGWLLNLTNDGWFGVSTGPYQHFHMSRLRAVEQGLPLVRGANNGISAIIDSYGRIVGSLGLNEAGILTGYLPHAAKPTIYAKITH